MIPPKVDVLTIIEERVKRYFTDPLPATSASVRVADARMLRSNRRLIKKTITSPPYFGMDTYVSDQWLRNWFVGGQAFPTYVHPGQISFGSPQTFASELGKVWRKVAGMTSSGSELVVRLGALASRPCDPNALMRMSLLASGAPWNIVSVETAGDAFSGRRQTSQMGEKLHSGSTVDEIDVVCRLG